MIPAVMETTAQGDGGPDGLVVVVDIRGRRYFGEELERSLEAVEGAEGWEHRILFIDSDDASLLRRYKESRRPHPAARNGDVLEAIRRERQDLANVREMADLVVDTSNYSALDTRLRFKRLAESFSSRMTVSLISFGFKHGTPLDVDTLLDVRFLPNPHYDPELRPLTGHDAPVREAVLGAEDCQEFLREDNRSPLLPHPPLRRRRQDLLHPRHRLHRRQAPLRSHNGRTGQTSQGARRGDRPLRQAQGRGEVAFSISASAVQLWQSYRLSALTQGCNAHRLKSVAAGKHDIGKELKAESCLKAAD